MARIALVHLTEADRVKFRRALDTWAELVETDNLAQLRARPAAYVVVGLDRGRADLDRLRLLRASLPQATVLAYAPTDDAPFVLDCIRSGAADLLDLAVGEDEIRLRFGAMLGAGEAALAPGTVVALMAPACSLPWTAVAAELAVASAQALGRDQGTVLVDLSDPPTAIDLRINVQTGYTLRDAQADLVRMDRIYLQGVLAEEGATGLRYLPLGGDVDAPADDGLLTLGAVVQQLAAVYALVLLFAPGARRQAQVAQEIAQAHRRLVFAQQDLATLRQVKIGLDRCRATEDRAAETDAILLYGPDRRVTLPVDRITSALGLWSHRGLPAADIELMEAGNAGRPLVLAEPRHRFSRGIRALAEDLARLAARAGAAGTEGRPPRRRLFARS